MTYSVHNGRSFIKINFGHFLGHSTVILQSDLRCGDVFQRSLHYDLSTKYHSQRIAKCVKYSINLSQKVWLIASQPSEKCIAQRPYCYQIDH